VQTILDLRAGLPAMPIPAGYQVRSLRQGDLTEGKPPVLRISAAMYRRIRDTPLYREDMPLVVVAPDARIAAECICWVDPINGIGIFEPVRTQEGFQRRGLARAMMAEGLCRMAACGVRWAKVSHFQSNTGAAALCGVDRLTSKAPLTIKTVAPLRCGFRQRLKSDLRCPPSPSPLWSRGKAP
jgi:hypothetical protein